MTKNNRRKTPKKPRKSAKTTGKKLREGERATVKSALDGTVTATELSEILGVTDQTLRNLAAQGMPKASRGRYPLRDAARWYLDTIRKRQEKPEDGPSRTDIARDIDLLKLRKLQGEVFDRREVLDTMNGAYDRLGAAHELLTTRIGRELNLSTDDAKAVREMIDEMRRAFVEDMGEFIDPVKPADDDDSDAAAA